MAGKIKAVRWTIEFAGSEFGKPREKVTLALKNAGEMPGADGKFSTRQIANALFDGTALEREAKSARHRQQIDEAEMIKNDRDVQEGKVALVAHMKEFVADVTTRLVQMIRQSDLKEPTKKQWIAEIGALKFEPTKVVPFRG